MDIKPLPAQDKDSIPTSTFDLGDSIFYAEIGELHSKVTQQNIHIENKVSQVFQCLVKARGEVVTREQIFDTVWPNMTVSDDSLNRCISVLRKILREFDHGLTIKTHPKVGFHLAISQSTLAQQLDSLEHMPSKAASDKLNSATALRNSDTQSTGPEQGTAKKSPSYLALITSALIVISSIIATVKVFVTPSSTVEAPIIEDLLSKRRIVVQPFQVPDTLLIKYGALSDHVNSLITQHPNHTGVDKSALKTLTDSTPQHIGEALSSRFILKGVVTTIDHRDLLNWQLVDTSNGDILLSKALNLKLSSESVNSQIIMTDTITAIGKVIYGDDTRAHVEYIVSSAQHLFTQQSNWQAHRPIITLVAKAIAEVDPDSALALKALAKFLIETMWPLQYQSMPYTNLAIRVLEKAITLTPQDVELYELLMQVYTMQYDWQSAREIVKLGQEQLPQNNVAIANLHATLQLNAGQITPSLFNYFQHAHQNHPLVKSHLIALTSLHLLNNDHDKAYRTLNSLIMKDSEWKIHGLNFGPLYLAYGDERRADELIYHGLHYLGLSPRYIPVVTELIKAPANNHAATKRDSIEQAYQKKDILPSTMLFVYSALGDVNRFYPLALELAEHNQFNPRALIGLYTEKLRQDPRYIELMEKIGLVSYWKQFGAPKYCLLTPNIRCNISS